MNKMKNKQTEEVVSEQVSKFSLYKNERTCEDKKP